MLFGKNDERTAERVLYKTKPNMVLGCKKAIYGVVLLAIAFVVSPMVIQFIGKMQVYLISDIQMPLTRYTAIAFFVVILVIILYIIWQLLRWFSIEYTLTDTRIIIKTGLLSTKKNYMPYRTVQDVNTSQSILARLFNVGTVSAFSAYDNNQIKLENVSNPSKVEEIIFNNMLGYANFQEPPRNYIERASDNPRYSNDDYYDEYEPITPIGHERNNYPRREYEYYPEDDYGYRQPRQNTYEYEPYEDELERNVNRVMNTSNDNIRYEGSAGPYSNDGYYNEAMDDYSAGARDYYQDNNAEHYQRDVSDGVHQEVEEEDDSREKVIRRHFDKFKK